MRVQMRAEFREYDEFVIDEMIEWMYRVEKKQQKKNKVRNMILLCGSFITLIIAIMTGGLFLSILMAVILVIAVSFVFGINDKWKTNMKKQYIRKTKKPKKPYVYYDFDETTFKFDNYPKIKYKAVQHYIITDSFVVLKGKWWYFMFGWDAVELDRVNDLKILLVEKFPLMNSDSC